MKFAATLALATAIRLRVNTEAKIMQTTSDNCQQTNMSAMYASGNANMCSYYNNASSSCNEIGGYYGCSWMANDTSSYNTSTAAYNTSGNSTSYGNSNYCKYTRANDKWGTYNYCTSQ